MSQTLIGGVLIILLGLGAAWLGLWTMRASRSYVPFPSAAPQPPSSRLEARLLPRRPSSRLEIRLRGLAILATGLAMVGYGVTGLRYLRNHVVSVPPSAPLLDQLIWLFTFLCLGSFFVLVAVMASVQFVQHRRARR